MDARVPRVLLSIALAAMLPMVSMNREEGVAKENVPHSRQKRLLWITNDGRLALPPGTTMTITPSLSLPFVRHPPVGFLSNMTMAFPFSNEMKYMLEFKIDFDKLGLTDNENPFGDFPPILSRSMGRAAVTVMADYIGQYLNRRRGKRSTINVTPEQEKAALEKLYGGERAILYGIVEDLLSNFGLSGKDCLLRTICEIQAHPLTNYGFIGEIMKLFFTPSNSPFADLMHEYVEAQKAGQSGGECSSYYRLCPKSIFQSSNKYSQEAEDIHRRYKNIQENKIQDVMAM